MPRIRTNRLDFVSVVVLDHLHRSSHRTVCKPQARRFALLLENISYFLTYSGKSIGLDKRLEIFKRDLFAYEN